MVVGVIQPRLRASDRVARVLVATVIAALLALPWPATARAADLSLTARALLGGHVRAGAWTAVEVELVNEGPPITGELRLGGNQQGRSTYGVAVDLPTHSRKRETLYAQPSIFRREIRVDLISGDQAIASQTIPITPHESGEPVIAVVAERPQAIVPDLSAAATLAGTRKPAVLTLVPGDLPGRAEAWSAIDQLVWQDTESTQLSDDQKRALGSWVTGGGRLVILGGTTGSTTFGGFPDELLPFRPASTVNASRADLGSLLQELPDGPKTTPAVGGTLVRGAVLARSGDRVIAAEANHGHGAVTLIGFDPGEAWLAGSGAAQSLWRRIVPRAGSTRQELGPPDDSPIVNVLGNLPAADLPPIEQLFVLLIAYILLVGPINYFVLRRLDRREWAWLTMPVLVALFAVASYSLGILLKGTDVIVNEVGIVRAAPGSTNGTGQVYVGIFSPTRQTFDVRVEGNALLTNPLSQQQSGAFEQPLDVLFGEPARLRDYQVGFGALRSFRAEADVETPLIEADLRFVEGRLQGSITNHSQVALESPAVVFGADLTLLSSLGPGETRHIDLRVTADARFAMSLPERLFGSSFTAEPSAARSRQTRQAVMWSLTDYHGEFGAPVEVLGARQGLGATPTFLAWVPAPAVDVELVGQRAKKVGETLYVMPLSVEISGPVVLPTALMRMTVVEGGGAFPGEAGGFFQLNRGTMTVEYRPRGLTGTLRPRTLTLALGHEGPLGPVTTAEPPIDPLPPGKQPDQEDPLGDAPAGEDFEHLPDVQLFDRRTGRWVQFPPLAQADPVNISHPERYLDPGGGLLVRFVNPNLESYFSLSVSIAGMIE